MIRALDMVNDILRAAGVPTVTTINATADLDALRVLQDLNYAGTQLGSWYTWRWLECQHIFNTTAEYKEGDADVTVGSTIVTSDNAATGWTPDMVGRMFKTDGYQEVYRIKRVNGAQSLELTQAWNGTTATNGAYVIAEDEYLLPQAFDDSVELDTLQFITPEDMELVSSRIFDQIRFNSRSGHILGTTIGLTTDHPRMATIRGMRDGRYVMALHPIPKNRNQIIFNYFPELREFAKDDDAWGFPPRFKALFKDWGLSQFRKDHQDDARSQVDFIQFSQKRAELDGLKRRTDNHARFIPPTGQMRIRRGRFKDPHEFDGELRDTSGLVLP